MTTRTIGAGVLVMGLATAVVGGVVMFRESPATQTAVVTDATPESPRATPEPEPAPASQVQTVQTPPPQAPRRATPPVAPVVTPASESTSTTRTVEVTPPPASVPVEPPPAVAATPVVPTPPVVADPPRYVPDPLPSPAPPPVVTEPVLDFDELVVERNAVIGIRLDHAVSTRTARVEDRISATVTRDVQVGDRVAIAAGARLEGTIVAVERGGKFRTAPRIGLQFDTLILTDKTRMSIDTEPIFREGTSPSADATAKVGTGAVVGGILGAVLGGKKGAAIGAAAGGVTGAATVAQGDGEEVALRAGASLTVKLTDELIVQVRR
ncbi:MAG: hypothetical protein AB7L71_13340 [Vicinamibacterales bacterium]